MSFSYAQSGYCHSSKGLVSYSEAVFAISATIAVLPLTSIGEKTIDKSDMWQFLRKEGLSFLAAFLGFQFVSRARGRHVKVFEAVTRVDDVVNSLNGLHLMLVALMPFVVTGVAGITKAEETLPVALFLGLIIAIDLSSLAILLYAKRAGLFQATVHKRLEMQETASMQGSVADGSRRGSNGSHPDSSLTASTYEAPEVRQMSFRDRSNRHFNSIVTRLVLMCLINAGLIGVAVANDIAALVLAYVLGTTVTKAVFKRLPVVGSVLRGELKNNLNKDRLLCYRDNVFSILSTLLIFDVGARVVNAAKENPEHGSEAFAHALKTNLHFLAGFVLNFIISTALWALHESMFLHIKNLSSTWRSFHQLVLALGCYVPFVCTVVGAVLSIADKADQQEAAKLLFATVFVAGSFFLAFWLLLRRFKPEFLIDDETQRDWQSVVLGKLLVLPVVGAVGFGVAFATHYAPLVVFAIPVVWFFNGTLSHTTVKRRLQHHRERTSDHASAFMESSLDQMLLDGGQDEPTAEGAGTG